MKTILFTALISVSIMTQMAQAAGSAQDFEGAYTRKSISGENPNASECGRYLGIEQAKNQMGYNCVNLVFTDEVRRNSNDEIQFGEVWLNSLCQASMNDGQLINTDTNTDARNNKAYVSTTSLKKVSQTLYLTQTYRVDLSGNTGTTKTLTCTYQKGI